MDNLIYPEEKNFKSLRQITFGGDNAETYWDVNDSNLVFQSNNPDWGVNCDQIFIIDKSDDLSNKKPKMISGCGWCVDVRGCCVDVRGSAPLPPKKHFC